MKLFEGSGGFRRDFIHVDDTVRMNLHFWESGTSGIFNCGTGHARSFADIGTALQQLHGSGVREAIPFPEDLRGKYQEFTEANLTQVRKAGYRHDFLSLEEGLHRYHARLSASGGYL